MTSNSSQDWQVFISCKVSDENDEYTRDWYIAKELYELLKANSIRVFMSSFSIEELGEAAYKEVIEEALDKALVMVVVGTTKENLNSKWVKYEWDSFHNEIISGRKLNGQIVTVTDELTNADLPYALRQNQSYKTSRKARLLNFIKRKLESFDSRESIPVEEIEEEKAEETFREIQQEAPEEKTDEIEEVGSNRTEEDENLETGDKSSETSMDISEHEPEEASADKISEEMKEEIEEEKAEETLRDIQQEAPEDKTEDVVYPEKEQEEQQPQIIQQDEKTSEQDLQISRQNKSIDTSASMPPLNSTSRIEHSVVLVEKGSFMMGDEVEDLEIYCRPVHEVILTNSFLIGRFQVTFEEYDLFCDETGRSRPKDEGWERGQRPVINVSWWHVISYCNWLSEKEGLAKTYDSEGNLLDKNGDITTDPSKVEGYRLPTEAEREYAARGGSKSKGYKYAGSDNVGDVAWYDSNSEGKTQEVGKKEPNELGIYDMSGNVWEWCSDRYGLYLISVQTNPYNCSGSSRVTRGGSWSDFASSARVANRDGKLPTGSYSYIGFRICRTVFEDTAESKEISEDGINKTSKSRKGESVVAKENTEETNDGKADNYVNETHSEEQELQTIHQGEKIDHHETPVKKRRIALPLFIFFTVLVTIAIAVMSLQGHLSSSSVPPMVLVERGSFTMGDTWGDGESDEKPTHKVTFTYDFYLGKYEITFDEYDDFCEATGRSKPKDEDWGRGQRPVINVSWDDAIGFCNWLSEKDKLPKAYDNDGNLLDKDGRITADPANVVGYRLPTEAEWEYAARGGNKSKGYKYSGSDNVDKVAWYGLNLGSKTQEVGKKTPNELGIYDMSGNVWEWCSDRYGHYSSSAKTNPYNDSGSGRVDRGGGWSNLATVARVANRGNFSPTFMRNNLGFRIARTVP